MLPGCSWRVRTPYWPGAGRGTFYCARRIGTGQCGTRQGRRTIGSATRALESVLETRCKPDDEPGGIHTNGRGSWLGKFHLTRLRGIHGKTARFERGVGVHGILVQPASFFIRQRGANATAAVEV